MSDWSASERQEIEKIAYSLWEEAGRPPAADYWAEAEREYGQMDRTEVLELTFGKLYGRRYKTPRFNFILPPFIP